MWEGLIILAAIAFIFDGIKVLIESYKEPIKYEGKRNKKETTAVVSVYNSLDILDSIDSIKREFGSIIIINDGSDDGTEDILLNMGKTLDKKKTPYGWLYTKKYKRTNVKLLFNEENRGKVPSIHSGLEFVDTKYVFICDDDIKLSENFELPVSLLEDDEADAVSFFVLPEPNKSKLWYNLQLHEYIKSMQIGRRFAGKTKSVECVSGCSGLFKTERILRFSKDHSSKWEGEDLERTLIELINEGRVIYSEQLVFTDVPKTFISLAEQRIFSWWGGLYRNFGLFIKILRSKKQPLRLRLEVLYNIISLILDPIKLFSLFYMVYTLNWVSIVGIYIIYAIFESFIWETYVSETKNRPHSLYTLIYPFYGFAQLIFRVLAGLFMLKKYIGKKLFTTLIITFISSVPLLAQQDSTQVKQDSVETKPDWTISYEHAQYGFDNEIGSPNHNLYVGWRNYYTSVNYGLFDQVMIGTYYKRFQFDISIRKEVVVPTLRYEQWFGDNTLMAMARYNQGYNGINTELYPNTSLTSVGYGMYRGNNFYSLELMQEFEREYATTLIATVKQEILNDFRSKSKVFVNNKKDYVFSQSLEYNIFGLGYMYHTDFDFTGRQLSWINGYVTVKF